MYSTAYKEMSVDWRLNGFWTVVLLVYSTTDKDVSYSSASCDG